MLIKKLSPLATVTLILIAITVLCLLNPGIVSFFIFLFTLLAALVLMLLHLLLAWRKITVTQRLSIILSIVAWMGLLYGLVHANGLRT
jgi:hypothetical protein